MAAFFCARKSEKKEKEAVRNSRYNAIMILTREKLGNANVFCNCLIFFK